MSENALPPPSLLISFATLVYHVFTGLAGVRTGRNRIVLRGSSYIYTMVTHMRTLMHRYRHL